MHTLQRTVGEIATPFVSEEEAYDACIVDGGAEQECQEQAAEEAKAYDDVYSGSTFEVDLQYGLCFQQRFSDEHLWLCRIC